jgi:hypothetical protein
MATRPRVKARTGCLTCKARKVKCDESRPSCRRCTLAGRTCDRSLNGNSLSRVVAWSSPGPNADGLLSNGLHNDEIRWLEHFHSHTGPSLSGDPDYRSFWTLELPQLSVSESAIRHALLAVGSCHARYEAQLEGSKHRGQIEDPGFAIKHYNLAIANLRKVVETKHAKPHVPLICCLLFICLECLYGNTKLILTHLQNGLKILDSYEDHPGNNGALKSLTTRVHPIFDLFKAQSTVFGMTEPISIETTGSMDFPNATGAKAILDRLIRSSMSFVKHKRHDYGEHDLPDDGPKRKEHRALLDQLLAWENRMNRLAQREPPEVDLNDPSVLMLHIRQQSTFVYLAVCLDPHQTFCDAFLPRFKAITDLTKQFMGRNMDASSSGMASLLSSTFSLESSLIPALYLTAIKCRDSAVRRCAIALLEKHPGREGLWDAKLYARVATRVADIEEAGVSMQEQSSPHWPEERFRVYRTDVERISEDPVKTAKLTFHTAPNGYFDDKVIWSEDITF